MMCLSTEVHRDAVGWIEILEQRGRVEASPSKRRRLSSRSGRVLQPEGGWK